MKTNLLKIAKNIDLYGLNINIEQGLLNNTPFVTRKPNGMLLCKNIQLLNKPRTVHYRYDYINEMNLCITNYININKEILHQACDINDDIKQLIDRYFVSISVNQELYANIAVNHELISSMFKLLFNVKNVIFLKNEKESVTKVNVMNKFPYVKGINIFQKDLCESFRSLTLTANKNKYPSVFLTKETIVSQKTANFFSSIFDKILLITPNKAQLELINTNNLDVLSEDIIDKYTGFEYTGIGLYLSYLNSVAPNEAFNKSFFYMNKKNFNINSSNISYLISNTLTQNPNALPNQANINLAKNINQYFCNQFGDNFIESFYELDAILSNYIFSSNKNIKIT